MKQFQTVYRERASFCEAVAEWQTWRQAHACGQALVHIFSDGADDAEVESARQIVEQGLPDAACVGASASGNLFEGSKWLMAWADTIEEVKTVCWCGRKATCNARIANGRVVKTGEQIMLGGNESYVALCRKHWAEGKLGDRAD